MTELIYLENEYLKEFDATVKEVNKINEGKYEVYLDKTAFYPEKGGQPCDLGTIDGVKVLNVEEKNGEVVHITENSIVKGQAVHCIIDWDRRFENMQQHAGQHLLAAAFVRSADAYTVSMHIGSEFNTIDVDIENLSIEDINKAEQLANKIVFENRKINKFIVNKEEAEKLPLRKKSKVEEDIRIVEIQDFDMSPCGGTHPNHTGEIGLIKVLRSEKYKKMIRIEFVCGIRALNDYVLKNDIIKQVSAELSSKPEKIMENLNKQNGEKKQLQDTIREYSLKLSTFQAEKMAVNAAKVKCDLIIKTFNEVKFEELKTIAEILSDTHNISTIFGLEGAKKQVVITRAKDKNFDISKAVRAIGIKGGGNDKVFQGVVEDFKALDGVAKIFVENK